MCIEGRKTRAHSSGATTAARRARADRNSRDTNETPSISTAHQRHASHAQSGRTTSASAIAAAPSGPMALHSMSSSISVRLVCVTAASIACGVHIDALGPQRWLHLQCLRKSTRADGADVAAPQTQLRQDAVHLSHPINPISDERGVTRSVRECRTCSASATARAPSGPMSPPLSVNLVSAVFVCERS